MTRHFDMVIIGSGPAGESAALNASKHGKYCAVIEERDEVGGSCVHRGTIPSKALRQSIRQLIQFNRNPVLQPFLNEQWFSYPLLIDNARRVVATQVTMRRKFYTRNRIDVLHGRASFVDRNTLTLALDDGGSETISADSFVIATGSRPFRPAQIDFDHPRVYDSDTLLEMRHTPRKIIVYGAGIIGCEYASILCGLGIKVELVNTRRRLLEYLDDEISDALGYHLSDSGVMIRHCETIDRLDTRDDGISLHLDSGKVLHGDAILWSNGRTGNTSGLGFESLGLATDRRGHIQVDKHYQTTLPHIYAVGDVIGWPSLASAAYIQGRSATAAERGKPHPAVVSQVATGIYTLPEISSVGKTEQELTEAKQAYEVGRAHFKDTARGQISGESVGMLKILFDPSSLGILGIHCFGAEATEIIHIGQAIMDQPGKGNTIEYFVTTAFNYPTMAEAYRIAALNGLNRLAL